MFFQNLHENMDGYSLALSLSKSNDLMTVSILPVALEGDKQLNVQPFSITGTPKELDEQLGEIITKAVERTTQAVSNINFYTEALKGEEKAAQKAAKAPAEKKAPAKKGAKAVDETPSGRLSELREPEPVKEPEPEKPVELPPIGKAEWEMFKMLASNKWSTNVIEKLENVFHITQEQRADLHAKDPDFGWLTKFFTQYKPLSTGEPNGGIIKTDPISQPNSEENNA